MRTVPIDLLIEEVNKIAKHPDPSSLRVSVLFGVIHVLKQIGVEFTCEYVDNELVTIREHKLQIPEDVVLIDDFRFPNGDWSSARMGARQKSSPATLAYRETPVEIYFPYFKQGDLIMQCYKLYKDEDDMPVIPADAYEACLKYCRFKAVEHRSDTQSQEWREKFVMEQSADRAIYYARGAFNSNTSASARNLGQSLRRGNRYN